MDASKVAANEPTPWVGVTERIAVFGSMLWISVLAISLFRVQGTVAPGIAEPGAEITGVSLRRTKV